MAKRWHRAALVFVLTCGLPAPAAAEWYFTPFIGSAFSTSTTFIDLEYVGESRRKLVFGGSAALIAGVIGAEVDYAYVPRFSQDGRSEALVASSHVQTLTGNIILTAPLSLTRESLRPYIVGGIGWMDTYEQYISQPSLNVNQTLTAMNIGGGAIGMFGNRVGLRFDLRRFVNLDSDTPSGTTFGNARVKFWRGTVGFTLRY